jgi:protoporphyrinogen oxidase
VSARPRVVVIGAGASGVATALGLGADVSCVVLERRAHTGGLCASVEIEGAVFDLGGHAFTTPHADVRALVFGALPMVEQKREARCWVDGMLIEYPFQRHFAALPDARVVDACARGLDEVAGGARGGVSATNFENYLRRRFGAGIATHFLLPYNRKLWARDLRALATDWVEERVAAPAPDAGSDAGSGADGGRRTPLAEETRVAYPAHGGYGEIVRALARRVSDIRLGTAVERIDLGRREVVTSSGAVLAFDWLVSTIAVDDLLSRIDGAPALPRAGGAALEAVSLALGLVVVDGPVATRVQRIYVADPRVLAHKIVLNHNSSDSLRRRPRHAVSAEIAFSTAKPLLESDLQRRVVEDLITVGVIARAADVRAVRVITLRKAYPVPTHTRAAHIRDVQTWLAHHGVYTIGRLGEWAYVNADECLRRGLALGRALATAAAARPMQESA